MATVAGRPVSTISSDAEYLEVEGDFQRGEGNPGAGRDSTRSTKSLSIFHNPDASLTMRRSEELTYNVYDQEISTEVSSASSTMKKKKKKVPLPAAKSSGTESSDQRNGQAVATENMQALYAKKQGSFQIKAGSTFNNNNEVMVSPTSQDTEFKEILQNSLSRRQQSETSSSKESTSASPQIKEKVTSQTVSMSSSTRSFTGTSTKPDSASVKTTENVSHEAVAVSRGPSSDKVDTSKSADTMASTNLTAVRYKKFVNGEEVASNQQTSATSITLSSNVSPPPVPSKSRDLASSGESANSSRTGSLQRKTKIQQQQSGTSTPVQEAHEVINEGIVGRLAKQLSEKSIPLGGSAAHSPASSTYSTLEKRSVKSSSQGSAIFQTKEPTTTRTETTTTTVIQTIPLKPSSIDDDARSTESSHRQVTGSDLGEQIREKASEIESRSASRQTQSDSERLSSPIARPYSTDSNIESVVQQNARYMSDDGMTPTQAKVIETTRQVKTYDIVDSRATRDQISDREQTPTPRIEDDDETIVSSETAKQNRERRNMASISRQPRETPQDGGFVSGSVHSSASNSFNNGYNRQSSDEPDLQVVGRSAVPSGREKMKRLEEPLTVDVIPPYTTTTSSETTPSEQYESLTWKRRPVGQESDSTLTGDSDHQYIGRPRAFNGREKMRRERSAEALDRSKYGTRRDGSSRSLDKLGRSLDEGLLDRSAQPPLRRYGSRDEQRSQDSDRRYGSRDDLRSGEPERRYGSRDDLRSSPPQRRYGSRDDLRSQPSERRYGSRDDLRSGQPERRYGSRDDLRSQHSDIDNRDRYQRNETVTQLYRERDLSSDLGSDFGGDRRRYAREEIPERPRSRERVVERDLDSESERSPPLEQQSYRRFGSRERLSDHNSDLDRERRVPSARQGMNRRYNSKERIYDKDSDSPSDKPSDYSREASFEYRSNKTSQPQVPDFYQDDEDGYEVPVDYRKNAQRPTSQKSYQSRTIESRRDPERDQFSARVVRRDDEEPIVNHYSLPADVLHDRSGSRNQDSRTYREETIETSRNYPSNARGRGDVAGEISNVTYTRDSRGGYDRHHVSTINVNEGDDESIYSEPEFMVRTSQVHRGVPSGFSISQNVQEKPLVAGRISVSNRQPNYSVGSVFDDSLDRSPSVAGVIRVTSPRPSQPLNSFRPINDPRLTVTTPQPPQGFNMGSGGVQYGGSYADFTRVKSPISPPMYQRGYGYNGYDTGFDSSIEIMSPEPTLELGGIDPELRDAKKAGSNYHISMNLKPSIIARAPSRNMFSPTGVMRSTSMASQYHDPRMYPEHSEGQFVQTLNVTDHSQRPPTVQRSTLHSTQSFPVTRVVSPPPVPHQASFVPSPPLQAQSMGRRTPVNLVDSDVGFNLELVNLAGQSHQEMRSEVVNNERYIISHVDQTVRETPVNEPRFVLAGVSETRPTEQQIINSSYSVKRTAPSPAPSKLSERSGSRVVINQTSSSMFDKPISKNQPVYYSEQEITETTETRTRSSTKSKPITEPRDSRRNQETRYEETKTETRNYSPSVRSTTSSVPSRARSKSRERSLDDELKRERIETTKKSYTVETTFRSNSPTISERGTVRKPPSVKDDASERLSSPYSSRNVTHASRSPPRDSHRSSPDSYRATHASRSPPRDSHRSSPDSYRARRKSADELSDRNHSIRDESIRGDYIKVESYRGSPIQTGGSETSSRRYKETTRYFDDIQEDKDNDRTDELDGLGSEAGGRSWRSPYDSHHSDDNYYNGDVRDDQRRYDDNLDDSGYEINVNPLRRDEKTRIKMNGSLRDSPDGYERDSGTRTSERITETKYTTTSSAKQPYNDESDFDTEIKVNRDYDPLRRTKDISDDEFSRTSSPSRRRQTDSVTTIRDLTRLDILSLNKGAPSHSVKQTIDVDRLEDEILYSLPPGHKPSQRPRSASGHSSPLDEYDKVSEKVEMDVKDGKAVMTCRVRSEKIVPILGSDDMFKKSSVIVTRRIEVNLLVTPVRRSLYETIVQRQRESGVYEPLDPLRGPPEEGLPGLTREENSELYRVFMGLAELDKATAL